MTGAAEGDKRVLILAPRGRDAAVILQVLERSGIAAEILADLPALLARLGGAAGALILTEEALADGEVARLYAWIGAQPPWSDLPVILLSTKRIGRRPEAAAASIGRLGNVVILERPINAETLAGAASAALRARGRQYDARAYLLEREQAQERLRHLNETLERRVEARTREAEAAHDALAFALESAGMGSWDLDLAHDVSWRSVQHDRIFGYDEPVASWGIARFLDHVLEEDRDMVAEAFSSAKRGGLLEFECRIRRRDGAVRWIAAKGRVEYDADGKPVRVAGVVVDRTEQRITEDALRQAQKMEALGQLTGGVAHDFNNLLTVIVGGLDMISRRPEQPERVKRLAETAMTAARRGEQLTQQLLAFSRRQMLRPQTLNANRLLLDFKPLAERAAGSAISLTFDLDPRLDPIRIDPAQFESAVLNLVVNARDAMDPRQGSCSITVRSRNVVLDAAAAAEHELPPGRYVEVAVVDTGSGIPPAVLERVFEPFFTTKDVGKGTGLGLSQVYGFTRSAKGFAAIDSVVGAGTTVRLVFPRSAEPADEEAGKGLGAVPLKRATDGETVLLVEDDEQVLGMAIESLEELRYKVLVARNAAEALEHLRGPSRIDIMFSDVVMPGGMSGSRLAIEARRVRPGLRILLTSGYVADLDEGQVIGHGETTVLNKPYRRDELARSLRIVLEGAGGGRDARPVVAES